MDEKELEALYKAMSEKFDIGEYDTFKTRMQTPDDRKKFYDAIGEQGFDLGVYDDYEKRLGGVKKKASSIDFDKSSLQSGDIASQSLSASPLPSEESGSVDPNDIIGSIEEAKKLENAGDFVVSGGTGGAAGSFLPNQESIKKSKDIITNIKKQGYTDEDIKSLYDDFKDFPKEAHDLQIRRADGTISTPYNKASLLHLKNTNPIRYKQLIGTIKNEFDIIKVAGIREGNYYNSLNQSDTLQEYYDNKKKQIGMINTYLTGEKKDKALARLYENSSSNINAANPELLQEYGTSEFKDSLDPNQFAGLQTLKIFKPNQYKQAINILKAKITPQYDISINPSDMGVAPPVPGGVLPTTYQTTDKSKGGKLAQETISQQVGQEEIKRALTDIGRNNAIFFAKKEMDGINSVYDDATPEEKVALQQEYLKHNYTLANAQEDYKKDVERFPLTSQMQFDQQVKEYTQKGMGALGYGTIKFVQGFKKTGDTIENLSAELFGSDDDKSLLQIKRIGELKRDQNEMYLPENLKMEGSPVIPEFSKELKSKADEILGNKDLSEHEKDSQLATLFKNNQDKIDYVTNPDASKHKNFFSKANLYENAGMMGDIGSLAAQSMGLGSLGAGRLVTAALPMFTTAQSDYYREAVANGEPNPMAYANVHATIMAAAGLINPKLDIVKKAVGMNTPLGKTLAGVSESTWNKVVKGNKPLIDKMINSATTVGKEAGKMAAVYGAGTSIANDVADKMFFDKPITSDEIINNAVKATKHLMYSSAGLFGLTAITNFKSVSPMEKARLWELGDNKEIAIKEIEEAVLKGEITPQQGEARKKITKDVSGIIDKIPAENSKGKLLTDRQRLDYFYNDLIKNKANEAKSNLPTSQAEKAENTALVADFKNDYILEPKTDKQLEARKSQLEKYLEPKKDAEGKTIEPNEKEVKESKAELEAITDIIENKPKEVDTKLSEPIKGLDEQGIPIGENVPPPTIPEIKTENGVSVESPVIIPESIPLKNEVKETTKNTIQAESEGTINTKVGEVEQPAKEGGEKPPVEPPKGKVEDGAYIENPIISFKKDSFVRARNKIGIEEFVDEGKTTHIAESTKAQRTIEKWKEDGDYATNMADIQERAKTGQISNQEKFVFAKHLADLDATVNSIKDVNSKEYDKALGEYSKALDAADAARSEAARQLGMIPKNRGTAQSLADVMVDMMGDKGVDKLTPEQKIIAEKRYDDVKTALDKEATLRIEAETKITELIAENELLKKQKENKGKPKSEKIYKDGKRDFAAEVNTYKDELKKLADEYKSSGKKMGIASDGGAESFIISAKMARVVMKIVAVKTEQIGVKLKEVTTETFKELKDLFDGITEKDVHDIIAGKYNEKKSTRNELRSQVYDLQREAKLLSELEALESGKEPATEKGRQVKNERLKDITDKIDTIKKQNGIGKYSEENKFVSSVEQRIKANKKKQDELAEKIKKGDYAEESQNQSILENTQLQKSNSTLYKEYQKSVIDKDKILAEYEERRIDDKIKNFSKVEKLGYGAEVTLHTAKGLNVIFDQSGLLVQLIQTTLAHPLETSKNILPALRDLATNKWFDANMAKLKTSKYWDIMQKMELPLYDTHSHDLNFRNELLGGDKNLLNRDITIGGKKFSLGKAFERSTATLFNNIRVKLAIDKIEQLYTEGKTWENAPEEFKSAGRVIAEFTAHGKVHKAFTDKNWNLLIWSTKMMASTFNTLGLGDIVRPVSMAKEIGKAVGIKGIRDNPKASKGFYSSLTPQARRFAAKEMGRFIGSGATILFAAYLKGKLFDDENDKTEIDINPLSTDFGSIKSGDKTVNVFGRYSATVKAISQVLMNKRYIDGKEDILGDKFADKNAGELAFGAFVRGKMTPIAGLIYDYKLNNKKNYYTKEDITALKALKQLTVPISFQDLSKDIERGDPALATTLWTLFKIYGGNVKDKRDYDKNNPENIEEAAKKEIEKEEKKRSITDEEREAEQIEKREKQISNREREIKIKEAKQKILEKEGK